ncbi:hypothetical protein HK100_004347 [Physocladia obscura]|uniref:Uncharacterized protein n=1 Tax=Physocladia obscura TaxID=109957 RepID=A0AAD5SVW0_9FUNG|nr:hypothetical protein HK100_004347 [Physocladia obscura]
MRATGEVWALKNGMKALSNRETVAAVESLEKAVNQERGTPFYILALKLYVRCFVSVSDLSSSKFKVSLRQLCDLELLIGIARDDTGNLLARIIAADAAASAKFYDECFCDGLQLFRLAEILTKIQNFG